MIHSCLRATSLQSLQVILLWNIFRTLLTYYYYLLLLIKTVLITWWSLRSMHFTVEVCFTVFDVYTTVKWFKFELECSLLQVTHTPKIFQLISAAQTPTALVLLILLHRCWPWTLHLPVDSNLWHLTHNAKTKHKWSSVKAVKNKDLVFIKDRLFLKVHRVNLCCSLWCY